MPKKPQTIIPRHKTESSQNFERDKTIVALCETRTLREIAQQFGITPQRVSQIYRRAKRREQTNAGNPPSKLRKYKSRQFTVRIGGTPMTTEDAIVWAVDHYWKTNFRPPTFREIQNLTGLSSTSLISYSILRIAKKYNWRISSEVSRAIIPEWVVQAIEQASPKGRAK